MEYNEITEGEIVAEKTFTDISDDGMKIVSAMMRDPNPIHFDRKKIENLGYPGLVNPGPINVAYITQTILSELTTPRNLVSLDIRFEEKVFEDETVTVQCEVKEKHPSQNENQVDLEITLQKDDSTVGATGTATVRLP